MGIDCSISAPDKGKDELTRDCESQCKTALRTPGKPDGYEPNQKTPKNETVVLENDKQAALWMDCVEDHACKYLDPREDEGGFCAPVNSF